MLVSSLLLAGLSSMAMAQTTEFKFIGVGAPTVSGVISASAAPSLIGSVVNVNAVATTLSVDCATDGISCTEQYTMGPSTFGWEAVQSGSVEYDGVEVNIILTIDHQCKLTGTTTAGCTLSVYESASAAGESSASSTVITTSFGPSDISVLQATATAGVSKFSQPQATQTPGAAAPGPLAKQAAGVSFGAALAAAVAGLL